MHCSFTFFREAQRIGQSKWSALQHVQYPYDDLTMSEASLVACSSCDCIFLDSKGVPVHVNRKQRSKVNSFSVPLVHVTTDQMDGWMGRRSTV